MKRVNFARAGAALAVALLAVAAPVSAQQPAPPPAAAPDEAELTVYAEAYLDIEAITKEAAPQLEAATTDEEKAAVQQAIDEKTAVVLAKREVEKARYDAITKLLETDEALRTQFDAVRAKVIEARKKAGS